MIFPLLTTKQLFLMKKKIFGFSENQLKGFWKKIIVNAEVPVPELISKNNL